MDYLQNKKKQMVALYQEDVECLIGGVIKDFKIADIIHFILNYAECQKYEGHIWKTNEWRT